MKKILLVVIFIILAGIAAWITIGRPAPKIECFEKVFTDGSVIRAKFTFNNASVSGDLTYLWAQKDNSTGTFNGAIKNGLILGNYHFFSEEVYSDNQLAFFYDGQSLVPGYGEKLNQFDQENKLVKIACK